jgi:hypothetical protein
MMTEVAHLGHGKSGNGRYLVSNISFPSSRFLLGFRDVGHSGTVACHQPAAKSTAGATHPFPLPELWLCAECESSRYRTCLSH